jgi:transketolase
MAGVAVGFSARGYHPVVSSFACFLNRAADQIRMAAFSGANILVNGSHAGVSIGEDGPSQMGLEDIAQFRAVHGSTVLYPSDAVSAERLTGLAVGLTGIVYIRTSRPESPVLYTDDDVFEVGGSKTFRGSGKEVVTVIGAGVTLHEARKAQEALQKDGISIRVIDCYSIKPIDAATLHKAASETKGIIVVEDHYPEGGLGEAVKSALAADPKVPVIHLAVYKTPRSAKAAQLLDYEGIASPDIIESVRGFLKVQK